MDTPHWNPPPILRSLVHGRRVMLVGAAPGFAGDVDRRGFDVLVTVNAAALGFKAPVRPDVTVMNTAVARSRSAGVQTRPRLGELAAGHLVVVEGGTPYAVAEPMFAAIARDSFELIDIRQRTAFLTRMLEEPLAGTSGRHVPSNGFFTMLLLLDLGAASVQVEGLSFRDGHSYMTEVHRREHIEMDRRVLALVRQRAGRVVSGLPEDQEGGQT